MCLVLTDPLSAGVTLRFASDWLADKDGAGLVNGALVMLVIDLDGDGFEPPTTSAFAPGNDDVVLGTTSTDDFGGFLNRGSANGSFTIGELGTTPADVLVGTIDEGDAIALMWFPDIVEQEYLNGSASEPGTVDYGFFRPPVATSGGDEWKIPQDGFDVDLTIRADIPGNVSTPRAGDVPAADLRAVFSTVEIVPEPSTTLLILLGLMAMGGRRRRPCV